MHMKWMILFPPVLLLGLVIGGWAPKEELRAARKEIAELSKAASNRGRDTRIDSFTRMVQIPDRAQRTRTVQEDAPEDAVAAADDAGTNAPPDAAASSSGRPKPEQPKKREPLTPEDLRARIDEAKELWKTRVDVARAQWLDRLKLSAEQATQFDDAINAMNERLYYAMQDFADTLENADTLTPEAGTRAFNELTSALTQTYDDLHSIVPEEQRGETANIELTDFIDPGVAEPLIAVQGKLENAAPAQRGRRGTRLFR